MTDVIRRAHRARRRLGAAPRTAAGVVSCFSIVACGTLLHIDDREYVPADAAIDGTGNEFGESPVIASDASGSSPLDVVPAHLRLWLTADQGITCVSNRVSAWADQSGRHDDAMLGHSQLGPQCQLATAPHVVNGVDLPYFSAPTAGYPLLVDETLDVDLSFLAGSEYTLFAVERRWADCATVLCNEMVIGTSEPVDLELHPMGCGHFPANVALGFGYVYYNGVTQFVLDQLCNTTLAAAKAVPDAGTRFPIPAPLSQETGAFDALNGHRIWIDGTLAALPEESSPVPLAYATGGVIGRSFVQTHNSLVDTRFVGDVAEVIVYDVSLSDADRARVEDYLRRHWKL